MPILITALIELSIYLAAVPVCAAFSLSTEGGLRLGVGFSAFERRVALRRARRGRPLRRPRSRTGPKRFFKALKRLRGADIRLQGRLGLGDAAATATACGALAALAAALGGQLGRVRVDVAPLFQEPGAGRGRALVEDEGLGGGAAVVGERVVGVDDALREQENRALGVPGLL